LNAPAPESGSRIHPDSRYLFAYSALTYNMHRIHYDLPYARQVEHHPDLVVHGPLLALWCAEYARGLLGSAPTTLAYRLVSPAYAGHEVTVAAVEEPGRLTVQAWSEGRVCAQLTVRDAEHVRKPDGCPPAEEN
jgi:3-methylfumaryl-CoA hydratase